MGRTTTTSAAVFIPEIWQDEVKAQYESLLVMGSRVKQFRHNGKPGDILHVPNVSNLTANDMTETGEVNAQSVTENEFTLTIDKWKEASIRINDLVKVQSKYDIRREYTQKMGFAVAEQIETDIMETIMTTSAMNLTNQIDADGTTASASGGTINVAGILRGIQYLDDNNAPQPERFLAVDPASRNDMLQINQFTSIDYMNMKGTPNGKIGQVFGLDVVVSNNLPSDTNSKTNALVWQKEAIAMALQVSPRTQAEYEQRFLSWLVTTDSVYGIGLFREDTNMAGLVLA